MKTAKFFRLFYDRPRPGSLVRRCGVPDPLADKLMDRILPSVSFTIPGRLSGANEIKSANRSHWSVGAKLVKEDKERCMWAIGRHGLDGTPRFKVPVTIAFVWIEPNAKRDIDNVTAGQKVILDALVLCGVIKNDTRQWIKGISHEFQEPNKIDPRIEVTVAEVQ